MDGIGRPTKRDPEKTAIVSKAMALGMSNKDAAAAAGIALSTLDEWMKIPEFNEQIESAVAMRKMRRLERIESGDPGWQSMAWFMERSSIFNGDIRWISPDLQIRCRLFEQAHKNEEKALPDSQAEEIDRRMRQQFGLPEKSTGV